MRDLSEQEIKELYESEYRNVPDVWDKVTDRIEQQAQEKEKGSVKGDTEYDSDEEKVLHFSKLGRKRWAKLLTAMAACFVIIAAYVLQNGTFMKKNSNDTTVAYPENGEMLMPEAAQEEAGTMSSSGDDAYRYDAEMFDGDAAAGAAEEQESAAEEIDGDDNDETNKSNPETATDGTAIDAWMNINGSLYVFDEDCKASVDELRDMEYLGESIYVADKAALKAHLQITGLVISGRVYESGTGEVYVLDESTNQVYGFREE